MLIEWDFLTHDSVRYANMNIMNKQEQHKICEENIEEKRFLLSCFWITAEACLMMSLQGMEIFAFVLQSCIFSAEKLLNFEKIKKLILKQLLDF